MTAQAVRQATAGFRGLRRLNAGRDMYGVALLLEESFKEDAGFMQLWSRVPLLREVGTRLWAANFAPPNFDSMIGFVWEENGRIIGNITLTPDESRHHRWMISNVAVDENYRRRGIARQLMLAAIDEAIGHGGTWVVLNVRPYNTGAIRLYEQLGFHSVDTEMGYVRRRQPHHGRVTDAARPLRAEEYRAALDLARAGMSDELRMFRPLRVSDFAVHFEDRVAERVGDFFLGQHTERWGIDHEGQLRATALLRGQRIGTPHSFDIRVHPDSRGRLEPDLVAFVLDRLQRFPPREIRTRALTSHAALVEALGDHGFLPTRGLTLMAKPLPANWTGGSDGR